MRARQALRRVACVFALTVVAAVPARAQGFVNPFVGYHFGGDSACPTVSECDNKKLTAGLSLGAMGNVVGFELDFGFAKDFFGTEAAGLDSNVVTLMANVMIVPKLGPVRPYVVGGFGLMRVTAATTLPNLLVADNNNLGYDLGGGVMIFFGEHLGIRGDIRGYRSLQDLEVFGVVVPDTKLNFGRAEVGLVLKF